jgi:hypothetical protein
MEEEEEEEEKVFSKKVWNGDRILHLTGVLGFSICFLSIYSSFKER